jgi:chromosomal replication initiator protein
MNRVDVASIQDATADHFGISRQRMLSEGRFRVFCYPRQVAMYITRRLTRMTFAQIGAAFGRDHSTVVASIQAIESRLGRSERIQEDVEAVWDVVDPDLGGAHP